MKSENRSKKNISQDPLNHTDPTKKGGVQAQPNKEQGSSRREDAGEGYGGASREDKKMSSRGSQEGMDENLRGDIGGSGHDTSRRHSGRDL